MTRSLMRVRISLDYPESVPALVTLALAVVDRMQGNPWFPSPVPSLATVKAAIDALASSQTAVLTRARGTSTKRDVALRRLKSLLTRLKAYVAGVAEDNLESAAAIVASASMRLVAARLPHKPTLAVLQRGVSGVVYLLARAVADRARYEWQMSADDGKTWADLPATQQSETKVTGLTPGKTYFFRCRAWAPKVSVLWCNPVALIVR